MEILIVISILAILSYVAVMNFSSMRENAELKATAHTLVSRLEESKAKAVAGLHGEDQGVHFTESTYTQFGGGSYDASNPSNVTHTVPEDLSISTSLSAEESVIFSRITGTVAEAVTIILTTKNGTEDREIIIGRGGDITYVEE